MKNLILLIVVFFIVPFTATSQFIGEVEGSLVTSGYNEIRIPGDKGTFFDAGKDFNFDTQFAYRLRAGIRIKKHNFFALYAPLKVEYTGNFDKTVLFNNATFLANTDSKVEYQFNSYRLTYRYDFVDNGKWRFGLGFTAKIRDAYIKVIQGSISDTKSNTGFVPIINLMAFRKFGNVSGIIIEGDGLVASQGRAFDFQASVPFFIKDNFGIKIGYRLLEGGADNDEVYNFTWINYYQAGIFYNFY